MRLRRILVLAGLIIAHLLILAAVLRPVLTERRIATSIAMVSVASPQVAVAPVVPPISELTVEAEVAPPDIASDGGGGGDCAIIETIARALADDTAARQALAAIPVAARSVANTAKVWDGSWPAANGQGDAVRRVVVAAIASAPAECRDAPLIGPRLVFVAGDSGITLAFGSGRWAWADLLE